MIKIRYKFRRICQHLFYWLEWWISDERKDPYRCTECGSTDVEIKVWAKVNEGGRYAGDCEEFERSFCNHCDDIVRVRPTSYLLSDIDQWFEIGLGPDDPEVISGLNYDDFATEEEFEAACKKLWNKRSPEEKIEIWRTITNRSMEG